MLAAQWRMTLARPLLTGNSADLPLERGQVLRLRTLVRLRWLAVVGQTAAVLSVHLVFGFPLPLGLVPCGHRAFGLAQHLLHLALALQRAAVGAVCRPAACL